MCWQHKFFHGIPVGMIVFSAGTLKPWVVALIGFVILLQSLLEFPIKYQRWWLYWKEGRKEKKLFYLRIWVLVTWDIGFGKCLTFFVRLFPLVAAVSFPNAPWHPSWVLQPRRSFQPVAGEKQTLWLAQYFLIPDSINKGKHWISGALHAGHFPVSVRTVDR